MKCILEIDIESLSHATHLKIVQTQQCLIYLMFILLQHSGALLQDIDLHKEIIGVIFEIHSVQE